MFCRSVISVLSEYDYCPDGVRLVFCRSVIVLSRSVISGLSECA